ncbi:MAG TPA: PD-(D/E)XK nuclease family protein [Candidatus Nanoarchaeia archaeon]|nr:PD-(D/E)XK nuclease family protein [Candidatus Nanoarchaeia archaeon]
MERFVTATMLSSYLYCPRKFFLQQVLKLREPLNDKLVKGKIRHDVLNEFSICEKEILQEMIVKDLHEIEEIYINMYSDLFKKKISEKSDVLNKFNVGINEFYDLGMFSFTNESKRRAFAVQKMIEKGVSGEELYENIEPRIISEKEIVSKHYELKGIIDRIEVFNDSFVPVEFKTGKTPREGVWQGNKVQIAAYCMLVDDFFGRKTRKGFVHYLDSDEIRPVVMNPFLKAEIIELRDKIKDILKTGEMPDFCRDAVNCRKNHVGNFFAEGIPMVNSPTESFK